MEPTHISAEDFIFKQHIQPLSFSNKSRSKRIKANGGVSVPQLAKKRFRGISVHDAGHQITRRSSTTPAPNNEPQQQQQQQQNELLENIDTSDLLSLLKKHVIYIDSALWNQQQLQQLAEGMGAKVSAKLDKTVGVYIIEPKENERLYKMASKASMNGIKCVSPNWIMTCYKEKKYHPPMNFPYESGKSSNNSQHYHYRLALEPPSQRSSSSVSASTTTTTNTTTNKISPIIDSDNPFGDEEVDFDYLEDNQPGMQRKMDQFITRLPSMNSSNGGDGAPSQYSSAQNGDIDQQQSQNSYNIPIGNLVLRSEVDENSQQQRVAYQEQDPSQARKEYFYNDSSTTTATITTTTTKTRNKRKKVLTPGEKEEQERLMAEHQAKLQKMIEENEKQKAEKEAKEAAISKNTRSNTQDKLLKKKKRNKDGPSFGDGRMRIWYGNAELDNTVPVKKPPTKDATTSPARVSASGASGSKRAK